MVCAGIAAWATDGRLTDGRNPRGSVKIQFAAFVTKSIGGETRKFRRAFNLARAAAMDASVGRFAILTAVSATSNWCFTILA
jgi:hypothetical protein